MGYASTATIQNLVNQVKAQLALKVDKLDGPHIFAGSCTFANLPAANAASFGKVYNVTDDFVTTADFVEGAGINLTAGTDVVVIKTASSPDVYKYDIYSISGSSLTEITEAELLEMWKEEGTLTFGMIVSNPVQLDVGDDILIPISDTSGTVSVASANAAIATAAIVIDGTTQKVKITGVNAGAVEVTVTAAATDDHRAATQVVNVEVGSN